MRKSYFNKEQKRKMRGRFALIHYDILEDNNLTSSDKIVYIVLARFVNNETQECFPSIRKIEKLTGLTDKTIGVCIQHLESYGYIEVNRVPGQVNIYQLNELPKNLHYRKIKDATSEKKGGLPPKNRGTNNTNFIILTVFVIFSNKISQVI